MTQRLRSVCIVLYGLTKSNCLLQPWRYVTEVAVQLSKLGHSTSILTEYAKDPCDEIEGIPLLHLKSVRNFLWDNNCELADAICSINPDVILWSVGLTTFLHQKFLDQPNRIQIGIFSTPIYSLSFLFRLGIINLLKNYSLSGIHLLGALSPNWMLRSGASQSGLVSIVTQTKTTCEAIQKKFWNGPIKVIRPGVDKIWYSPSKQKPYSLSNWGFNTDDFVVLYLGSPAPLRGLPVLIHAIAIARETHPEIKLLVLSRRRGIELLPEAEAISRIIASHSLENAVKVVEGFLEPTSLVEITRACDLVALPFQIIPSDAPLSLLEVQALGKPLLTTNVMSLPELVENGRTFLAEPGSADSLVRALTQAFEQLQELVKPFEFETDLLHQCTWQQVGREWSEYLQLL